MPECVFHVLFQMSMPQPGLHQILEDGLDVFSPEYSLSKEAADVVGSLRSHRSQPRSKRAKANPYDQVRWE